MFDKIETTANLAHTKRGKKYIINYCQIILLKTTEYKYIQEKIEVLLVEKRPIVEILFKWSQKGLDCCLDDYY